ncbi:MAG TPA: hypothetical protein VF533_07830 [Solirubrobacteraceae bacterium]|jgi:hypothetical protein
MTGEARSPASVEVVDGEPVVGGALERVAPAGALEVSSRQVAALAAGGFVAGVATVAMLGRRGAPRRRGRRRRKGALGEIVSTNSFLVDVHVLKR